MTEASSRLATALSDRYRVERELGAGGMATVYLAQDLKHDRKVALKVLRPELAAVIGAERFLSEIKTTANLQHPHILPLHDSGEADSFLYYVMPFIEGESLRDRLNREKQLPIGDAVRIAGEVASALDYAHRHKVIHRDIKPENILLHDGSALVADFGIALAASKAGGSRMTETGMSLGTPHYMSPEQAMGEREITARSDVYALGAMTYEMLLGEPPFTGPTAQSIVAKVMAEKPARLTPRRERIPAAVEYAVLTALEKLPADRFGSAAEFAAALRAPVGSVTGQDVTAPARVRLDWRLAALAGMALGAAVTFVAVRQSPHAAASFGARNQLTFNGRSRLPAIAPDGDYIAYVEERCARGRDNPCISSLVVQDRGSDRPVALLRDVPWLGAPRFSHDGLSVLVTAGLDTDREGLYLIPRLGGVPRRLAPDGVFDAQARADSAVLVITRPSGTSVAHFIALGTGTVADSLVLPDGVVDGVGWSPDGQVLALVEDYAKLTLVRRDGSVTDSLRGPFRSTVRWTSDGRGLLLFRALPVKEDDLVRFEIDRQGRIVGSPAIPAPAVATLLRGEFDLARNTGELVLATGSATWDLWTFELSPGRGQAQQRTSGTTWYGIPTISPDGNRLLYTRGDALGDNLYMLTLPDSEEALTAERYPGWVGAGVSSDGKRALFGHSIPSGGRLGVLDLASRQVTFVSANGLDGGEVPAVHEKGIVFLPSDRRSLGLLASDVQRSSLVQVPDSMRIAGFALNSAGDSTALLVSTTHGIILAVSPLGAWRARVLHTFAPDEAPRTVTWNSAGVIYFWLWRSGEGGPALWRVRPGGGAPERVGPVPAACNLSEVIVAHAAPRAVCRSEDLRSDIWLMNLPGVTR